MQALTVPGRRLTSYPDILSYSPPTNVVPHLSLDLDQEDIESYVGETPVNYADAQNRYENAGGRSQKPTKSIKSFSSAWASKLDGQQEFERYQAYYGDGDYAHKWVNAALTGTATNFASGRGDADFAAGTVGSTDAARVQAIKKGTVFLSFWMWALYEFEAGLALCDPDSTDENYAAVHKWDEGVAFYTGSLQTADDDTSGNLMYYLGQKRCPDFKTCGPNGDAATGQALSNKRLFDAATAGKDLMVAGNCDQVRPHMDIIINAGSIPFIQGALKYAYWSGTDDRSDKAKAEAAAFAAAVLPRVHSCSTTDAATIEAALKMDGTSTDFNTVKAAFERNYACMNVTCADIGGRWKNDAYTWEACTDPSSGLSTGALIAIIAGGVVAVLLVAVVAKKMLAKKPAAAASTSSKAAA